MAEQCSHDCSSCGEDCASREKVSLLERPHEMSRIKKVIGVVSGKGGVGKSAVTGMLAVLMRRKGYRVGVLDADITGPSVPKEFGLSGQAAASEFGLLPVETRTGIKVMSINLLLDDESTPVVWRGPIIGGTVKQFWTDVVWEDVDYLFVDMPPGTGDVPLTVFQSIPLSGIVIVTSPQDLVSMIVSKAVSMAKMMDIPILGLVENMSYVKCPDCDKQIPVFGESKAPAVAKEFGLELLAQLPLDPETARKCDAGDIETFLGEGLDHAADVVEQAAEIVLPE